MPTPPALQALWRLLLVLPLAPLRELQ